MVGELVFIKDKNNIDLVLNADGTIGIGTVAVSGSTVRLISGDTVQVIVRDIGGAPASVTGTASDSASSIAAGAADNGLTVRSFQYGAHILSQSWVKIGAIQPVSGIGFRLLVAISGEPVSLINDGLNNVVKISGQTVNIQGGVNVSGQTVRLTNDGLNNVVAISGQNVYSYGSTPKANALVNCTNLSGGTNLPNISCVKLFVRSISGNDVMYVGGTGAQAPWSGTGIELYGGEMMPIETSNANTINIFAATSGQRVSVFAIDR